MGVYTCVDKWIPLGGMRIGANMAEAAEIAEVEETAESSCCRHKETPRDEELQADIQKRLNRVIGQLNGVKAMIDDNRYCGDVLVQLSAAESAVHSISEKVLKNHMETCVVEQIQQGNLEVVDEVMQLMRRLMK